MSEAAATAGFSRWQSDERLTRRACGGDERAFAAIFRRYHQPLYRFCLAIVGNPEDAQDALQNTMIKVMRALPGEERKIELKPWLYRIAHNEAIDLLRRRRETRQLDAEQAAPGHGLAEDAATRERLRRLLADLRELPERQREVLVMRELSGLEFEEIGAALGTSDAVARQTLYEARQSLRQMEEGREMSCDEVTRALSDGDGRVTRRRDVRAHLRSCAACRAFREEIKGRQRDLAAISPLPAAAVAGMVQGLVGGSGAASSSGLAAALGGGAAKTIGVSTAAKGVATIAAVAAVGVGAADRTGVIHLGLSGERGSQPAKSAPSAPGGDPAPAQGGNAGPGAAAHPGRGNGDARDGHHGQAGGQKHPGAAQAGHGSSPHGGGPPSHANEHAHQHGKAPEVSKTPGPSADLPSQGGKEKEQPSGAAGGQGAATEHKQQTPEPGAGEAATPPQPPQPPSAPGSQAKGPPPNPSPAAAPESPGQAPSLPDQAKGKGPEAKP
ncbi:MAG TPA: RNA polymerase sigma factor [Solirubrobacterales bacterium]|nr:RNA polymerase sigma factor [Solirubrobacterales bacterium]